MKDIKENVRKLGYENKAIRIDVASKEFIHSQSNISRNIALIERKSKTVNQEISKGD